MFDLNRYLADLTLNFRSAFGERLLYMGLQGSWLRGEAHENSDIDVMVILDRFSVRDMDTYRQISNDLQEHVLPDPESAFSEKRTFSPAQKGPEGCGGGAL